MISRQCFVADKRLNYFYAWLFVGCVLIVAVNYASLTSTSVVPMPGHMDKLYHAFAYMCLAFWWFLLFPNKLARLLLALAFVLMGVTLEVIQSFHPIRHLDVLDMLANAVGVVLAALCIQTIFKHVLLKLDAVLFRLLRGA